MKNQVEPQGADEKVYPPGPASLSALEQTFEMEGGGWSVTVLPESCSAFSHYKQALLGAKSSIFMVMWYVFQDDPVINEIQQILTAKLIEGVAVKIVISNNAAQKGLMVLTGEEEGKVNLSFAKDLAAAGATIVDYSHDVVPTRGTHRKALVVDRSICITGSRNMHWIYQHSFLRPHTHLEIDLMVRNGTMDVVGAMQDLLESNDSSAVPVGPANLGEYVQSKPNEKLEEGPNSLIMERYVRFFKAATKSIQLVHWSFIPQGDSGEQVMGALLDAVKRGVQVKCVFNGLKQTKLQTSAGQTYLNDLLDARGPNGNKAQVVVNDSDHVIHCKYGVFDGTRICLGSFNFDDYSFDKNAEDLLVIESPALAAQLLLHAEWLRVNLPCLPANVPGFGQWVRDKVFGCCAATAVDVAQ